MANKTITQLNQATEPLVGTDLAIVSRNGTTLTKAQLSKFPISDATGAALQTRAKLKVDNNGKVTGITDPNDLSSLTFLPTYEGSVASTNGLPDFVFGNLRNIKSQMPRRFEIRGNTIRLAFATFQSGSSGEQDIPGSVKLEAYVTIRGKSYRMTFSGSNYIEGPCGKMYFSDKLTLPFYYNPGEEFTETVQALWTMVGTNYYVYRDSPQYFGFAGWSSVYKNDAVWTDMVVTNDLVETPSATGGFLTTNDNNYYGAYYGSCAILGETNSHTVVITGDSRQKLAASNRLASCIKNRWGITGEVASSLHARGIPFINLGWSGESYTTALGANKYTERKVLSAYGTVLVDCMGVNEIGAGASYSGTCTSTTTTSVTGASVSGATAAVGDFVEGPTLWPNTRIESGSGSTFTLSRAPISATTAFTLRRANQATLALWQNSIRQFRTMLDWWSKPYFHNTIFPRNLVDLTTGVRTIAPATPVINYFNWLLRTGQLNAPVDIGTGVFRPLIDGFVDGAAALVDNGTTGIYKTPERTIDFTSADGITMALNSNMVQSTAGSFRPWMTNTIMYIEGAGGSSSTNIGSGSTTLRGFFTYLNPNWGVLTIPNSLQDNTLSRANSIINATSTVYTRASTAVTNAIAHINNGNWDLDGLHLALSGESEVVEKGDFKVIENLYGKR